MIGFCLRSGEGARCADRSVTIAPEAQDAPVRGYIAAGAGNVDRICCAT